MRSLYVENFSLAATLESGQVFRWERIDGWHYVTVGGRIIKAKQSAGTLHYDCTDVSFDVPHFLGINDDYNQIISSISSYKEVAAAIRQHSGLRILRQEPWECTASFICSSFSNIKRIRSNLNSVAEAYGKRISLGSYTSHSFPSPESIASTPEKLFSCGLGYRAEYLAKAAEMIIGGFELGRIRRMGYGDAKKALMQLPGAGDKVADCILLFSMGFSEAFPVDVWIERAMKNSCLKNKRLSAKKIAEYGRARFGRNAGYAQQFLYHSARKNGKL